MRDLSKMFREFPDVYQNIVMLTAQSETDYFASSEGSQVGNAASAGADCGDCGDARGRRHGSVPRADI